MEKAKESGKSLVVHVIEEDINLRNRMIAAAAAASLLGAGVLGAASHIATGSALPGLFAGGLALKTAFDDGLPQKFVQKQFAKSVLKQVENAKKLH